jgi:hypothetical protein
VSDKLVERLRSRRKWDSARGMERAESPFPYLEEEAADRIEELERALAALVAAVEALPGSVFFDMIDQEVFDRAESLLTPSAAPERQ